MRTTLPLLFLFFLTIPPHTLSGLFPDPLFCTVRAEHGVIASWKIFPSADPASFHIIRRNQLQHQLFVQRQNIVPKIPAEQRIRDGLYADTSISFIQGKALIVLCVIIAALGAYEFSGFLQLRRCHLCHTHNHPSFRFFTAPPALSPAACSA